MAAKDGALTWQQPNLLTVHWYTTECSKQHSSDSKTKLHEALQLSIQFFIQEQKLHNASFMLLRHLVDNACKQAK